MLNFPHEALLQNNPAALKWVGENINILAIRILECKEDGALLAEIDQIWENIFAYAQRQPNACSLHSSILNQLYDICNRFKNDYLDEEIKRCNEQAEEPPWSFSLNDEEDIHALGFQSYTNPNESENDTENVAPDHSLLFYYFSHYGVRIIFAYPQLLSLADPKEPEDPGKLQKALGLGSRKFNKILAKARAEILLEEKPMEVIRALSLLDGRGSQPDIQPS